MRSLQFAVEVHRLWQIDCNEELWRNWYDEKEKDPEFQFLSGTISLRGAQMFCQISESLCSYPMELVNRAVTHESLQACSRRTFTW